VATTSTPTYRRPRGARSMFPPRQSARPQRRGGAVVAA
jgi:hypothetical protein